MRRKDPPIIGFNRRVDLEWLGYTVRLFTGGHDESKIHEELSAYLSSKLSIGSSAKRGSREKTITLLLKTWVRVRPEIEPLRDDGLELLESLPKSQHLAVHWGMTMAAYPFWGEVAAVTGRLLRLQGTAAAIQIQRRVREIYGEKETAYRSARYVVSAFHRWGALKEEARNGVYVTSTLMHATDSRLIGWLVEAYLLSFREDRATPKSILDNPAFFPFDLQSGGVLAAAGNPRLVVDRHGLDEDLVSLTQCDVAGRFS